MPIFIKDAKQFKEITSQGVTLVDFYADWCGPCKMIAPIVDELATEYAGKANIVKVNVDEVQDVASQFSIRSIPTLTILKDGKEIGRVIGFRPKADLKRGLDKALQV